jgi:glycosyltransferase involved in cell wall biosynthesis
MTPVYNKQNVVIILTGGNGFPTGDAYTNRVIAISKGLVQCGCKVSVLIIYPGRNNQSSEYGEMDGFSFRFCAGVTRQENRTIRRLNGLKGIVNAWAYLWSEQKREQIDLVLSFSQSFIHNFSLFLFSILKKTLLLHESSEYPLSVLQSGSDRLSASERLYQKAFNFCFDGKIYISTTLAEFNKRLTRKLMPILIVPIVVDTDRFIFPDTTIPEKRIAFCGDIFGQKDGVRILIEAFSKVHKNHPQFKLLLIGAVSNPRNYQELLDFIILLGLNEKVEFTGFIHRDKVPELLYFSSVLVLARPDNIQNRAGFPTKLGEYLATGRPVLTTAMSDIPLYIRHGENGFLAKPGDVNDFSIKLGWILANYQEADKIGKEGRKLTQKYFSNIYQANQIIKFVERIS